MEDQPENDQPRKAGMRTEFIVAMAAIAISLATLTVYIYQARIMQNQQHTAVWPYVEWTLTISTVEGIYLSVVNKGVGPALIKHTELKLDDQLMSSGYDMIDKLTNGKADSIWLFTSTVDKRVLAPGEEIRLFHLKGEELRKMLFGKLYNRIKYSICYCSIYGDCWTSTGLEVTDGKCD